MTTSTAGRAGHTPGPWGLGEPPYHTMIFGADGFCVGEASGNGSIHRDYYAGRMGEGHWATTPGSHIDRPDDEEEANAHLMRASLALYDLARAVAEHFSGTDSPLGEQARAALALAEGR